MGEGAVERDPNGYEISLGKEMVIATQLYSKNHWIVNSTIREPADITYLPCGSGRLPGVTAMRLSVSSAMKWA